jgi:hypothetical protein
MAFQAYTRFSTVCGIVTAFTFFGSASAAEPQKATAQPADTVPPPVDEGTEVPEKAPMPPCPTAEQPAPPPPVAETPPAPPTVRRHNLIFAPQEVSLTAGAGVSNYFGHTTTGNSDPGATWDARVTFGAHSVFAFEAGYVGSTNSLDIPTEKGGRINSHGFDGDLRLQLPTVVQPYIFGGVGYNHMSLNFDNATVGGQLSQNQVTIPAGAGLAAYLGRHVTVDLRGTYRLIPDNDITVMGPNGSLHQWVAQGHLGYVF